MAAPQSCANSVSLPAPAASASAARIKALAHRTCAAYVCAAGSTGLSERPKPTLSGATTRKPRAASSGIMER